MQDFIGSIVLVRDNRAGIHVGILRECDLINKVAVLEGARKVWYWEGDRKSTRLNSSHSGS
jgi:hypothetical protein